MPTEMKEGVFLVMHYLQPVKFTQLSLRSSANVGMEKGDITSSVSLVLERLSC